MFADDSSLFSVVRNENETALALKSDLKNFLSGHGNEK